MNNKGFTLIETLVALAIFIVVSVSLAQIIIISVQNQLKISLTQDLINQSVYSMEYMSKALRMAKKDALGTCLGTENLAYNFKVDEGNTGISFLAYDQFDQVNPYKCKKFIFANNTVKLMISSDDTQENLTSLEDSPALFSSLVQVNNVNFTVEGDGDGSGRQPRIVINMEVVNNEISGDEPVKMQTTISQRRLNL